MKLCNFSKGIRCLVRLPAKPTAFEIFVNERLEDRGLTAKSFPNNKEEKPDRTIGQ